MPIHGDGPCHMSAGSGTRNAIAVDSSVAEAASENTSQPDNRYEYRIPSPPQAYTR